MHGERGGGGKEGEQEEALQVNWGEDAERKVQEPELCY